MSVIVIYHKNCFDGICSAWVAWKKFGDYANYIPMSYGDNLPYFPEGADIYFIDFSLKRKELIQLDEVYKVTVIDHHKTAEKELEELDFCIFDMNESGASLAWRYFFPNKIIPRLVQYIKDRDLWRFNLHSSSYINAYIQSYDMDIKLYDMLAQELDTKDGFLAAQSIGMGIERYKKTMTEAICKNAAFGYSYPFYNTSVPIVATSTLFSEVGHELCKQFPDSPFSAYYFDRLKDNIRQWGLRSIGDFDVSEVAKKFGGGGHKNAAGFEQKLNEI